MSSEPDIDITQNSSTANSSKAAGKKKKTVRKTNPSLDVLTVLNIVDKTALIKSDICKQLTKNVTDFSGITSKQLADCSKLKKESLAGHLLDIVRVCDQISRSSIELSGPGIYPKDISTLESEIKKAIAKHSSDTNQSNDFAFQTIQDDLKRLQSLSTDIQTGLTTLSSTATSPLSSNLPASSPVPATPPSNVSSLNVDPHIDLVPDFIPDSDCEDLMKLVKSIEQDFSQIGSRSTVYYGDHDYEYTGTKHAAKKPPPAIQNIINSINNRYPNKWVNSCLVSRYADGHSFCPPHSDDEDVIGPESNIYTLSIGAQRKMEFHKIEENMSYGNATALDLPPKSLLIFSRQSQEAWQHAIPANVQLEKPRFSFTFRLIAPFFTNSTIIIGDSNTRDLYFGTRRQEFGQWMPGRREQCFTVADIPDPKSFGPFKNIVLHVGINDIKHQQLSHVQNVVGALESKCRDISEAYPRSNVYICPILPTKDPNKISRVTAMNRGIVDISFNIHNVLLMSNYFDAFGGQRDLLGDNLGKFWQGKPNQRDDIHLGPNGTKLLASCLKHCILKRKGPVLLCGSKPVGRRSGSSAGGSSGFRGQYDQAVKKGTLSQQTSNDGSN